MTCSSLKRTLASRGYANCRSYYGRYAAHLLKDFGDRALSRTRILLPFLNVEVFEGQNGSTDIFSLRSQPLALLIHLVLCFEVGLLQSCKNHCISPKTANNLMIPLNGVSNFWFVQPAIDIYLLSPMTCTQWPLLYELELNHHVGILRAQNWHLAITNTHVCRCVWFAVPCLPPLSLLPWRATPLRRAFGINPTANGMGSSFAYYAYLLHTPPLNIVYMCFLSRVAEGHFPLIQS